MPKVVHGIDCGARLAYFVLVTVLACTVSGYVFGAALSQPSRRGGATPAETVSKSDGRLQMKSDR